ncbi:hypothetical protein WJX72_000332 [[Myrmecia] bisecta]|uniref:Agenet domain-containing protein n=1 Tax=[Myrmecia] bisecta TaxID=41462 RepID=A0AAW1QDZ3_9CHLO
MAPKRAFKVGDEVEVAGKASEGFNDSWWQANVRKRLPNGSYEVEYMTLKDDDDETKYSVVRAKASRLRPPLYDDSLEVPFQDREVGQWVDCWTRGGFWTGYVEAVDDEQLTVYFPATYDREVVEEIKHPVDDAQNRVRTCMEWHNGKWLKRAPKPLAGMKNGQPTSSYTLEDASPATTPVASLAGSSMRQAESSNRSGTSDDRSTVEANEHLSRTSAAASIKPSKRVARAGSDNSKQPHATAKHKAKAVDARRQPMRSLSATEARDKSKVVRRAAGLEQRLRQTMTSFPWLT